MISLPVGISTGDLEQWVGGGWFFFNHDGEFKPAMMNSYPNENGRYQVVFTDGNVATSRSLEHVKPHWPVCGSLNVLEARVALYVDRLQRKQFCRTYNYRLVRVVTPGKSIIGGHVMDGLHPSSEYFVKNLFSPTYFSLPEIVKDKFEDGWASCAVSPTVIVLKQRPRNMIFYRGEIAGYLSEDNKHLEDVDATVSPTLLKHFGGDVNG